MAASRPGEQPFLFPSALAIKNEDTPQKLVGISLNELLTPDDFTVFKILILKRSN